MQVEPMIWVFVDGIRQRRYKNHFLICYCVIYFKIDHTIYIFSRTLKIKEKMDVLRKNKRKIAEKKIIAAKWI